MKIKLNTQKEIGGKIRPKGTTIEVANFIGVPLVENGDAIDLSGKVKKVTSIKK